MQNVLRFFLRYRILLTLILFQVGGLILTYRLSPIHSSIYWEHVLSAQAHWNQIRSGWKDYFDLEKVNQDLQAENAQLRALLNQPERKTVNAVDSNQFIWVYGDVIYGTSHQLNNDLILNRGTLDGVKPGQGVLSPTGVIGIVHSANEHFSKVTSLLHSNSRISGTVARTGFFGTVLWEGGASNQLQFIDLAIEADIAIGDTIVTDGRSAIFPAGWPIGFVVSLTRDDAQYTQSAVIEIWGSISRQQPAYVVRNTLAEVQNSLLEP